MKNKFKVEKKDKYFNLIYVGYTPANTKIDWRFSKNQWLVDKKSARTFVKYVCDVELIMDKYNKENNLNVEVPKIIRMYLDLIEAISCGFDIRSKWGVEKVGIWLVDVHIKKKEEARLKCEKIINQLKNTPTSQGKHWRKLEECDDLNEIYEFGFPKTETLCASTFNSDMDSMLEKSNELLELLIKQRKEQDA